MTATEQLRILYRQFPRAEELAVSRELLDQWITEIVTIERLLPRGKKFIPPPSYVVGGIRIIPTSLLFRDKLVVVTEPA